MDGHQVPGNSPNFESSSRRIGFMEDRCRCLAQSLPSLNHCFVHMFMHFISWKMPWKSIENPRNLPRKSHENDIKKNPGNVLHQFPFKKIHEITFKKGRNQKYVPKPSPPFSMSPGPPGPHRRSSTMNQKAQDPDLRRCDMGIYHGGISLQRLHRIGPSWVWVEIRPFFLTHTHTAGFCLMNVNAAPKHKKTQKLSGSGILMAWNESCIHKR